MRITEGGKFAAGVQNFAGGLALVGEEGPELLANLPRGTDVIPLGGHVRGGGGMAMAGGMGGGMTINVTINGDVNDAEAFYRKVNEARLEFERRGN